MLKKISIFLMAILFLIIGFWSFYIEPYNIQIENLELKIKNLPSSFKDIKIVHLSDFHSKNFGKREKMVLEILKELSPDFIFITGDIVDWSTRNFELIEPFWKGLVQNYAGRVFGVYGNHEHRNIKLKKLENLLKESGIEILKNESKKIELNNNFIYLIGIDDPHEGYDDLSKALKGLDFESTKILLAHSPEIFRKIKNQKLKIDLVLTGHTHGGQINIPILVELFIPLRLKFDRKYKKGLFNEDSILMYVNRGVAPSGIPFRFNCPPEITLIKLSR